MIYGLLLLIISDNGLQFVLSEFERYLKGCGIEYRKSMLLWWKQWKYYSGRKKFVII